MPPGEVTFFLFAIAMLSGVCFSLCGVGYRLGTPRRLKPRQLFLFASALGTIVFGTRLRSLPLASVPAAVWVLGIMSGTSLSITLFLVRAALKRGPLSAIWCAINLSFVLVIFYCWFRFGEKMRPLHYGGVLAACVCVVLASLQRTQPAVAASVGPVRLRGHTFQYGAILVLLCLTNCMASISIKELSMRMVEPGRSALDAFRDVFLCVLYGICGLVLLGRQIIAKDLEGNWKHLIAFGMLVALGSVGGLWLVTQAASLPAAVLFTTSQIVSIMSAAIICALAFREKTSPTWFGMIISAVAAVLMIGLA